MFKIIFFTLFTVTYSTQEESKCQFQDLPFDPIEFGFVTELEEAFQPIRVKLDYSNLTEDQQFVKQLLQHAISFIESTYSIRRSPELLEFKRLRKCGRLKVPEEQFQNGISTHDLVIYVGVVYDQDTYTALSSPCLRHSANHRTIAAQLVLNSRYFDSFNEQSKLKWLGTVVHELTHILGFSKNSFKLYGLLHRHKDGSHYLNAKELVEEGRHHFGCPHLDHLPLENDGVVGTKDSHWERQAFGNELMTGAALEIFSYSRFTLLALQATGLYKVDLRKASQFNWGRNKGCGAAEGSCHSEQVCHDPAKQTTCGPQSSTLAYCSHHGKLNQCPLLRFFDDCRWESQRCLSLKHNQAACFKAECIGDRIRVTHKGKEYFCEKHGKHMIEELGVYCPNHEEFCRYECGGRGVQHNEGCSCELGFTGAHCEEFVFEQREG